METSSPNQLKGNVNIKATTNNSCSQEPLCVSSILPNGINTNNKPIAGLDWSRKKIFISEKDKPIVTFPTLKKAASNYKGYIWFLESTADSFELQNRQKDINAIKNANIDAYSFPPRYTSKYRIKWGILKSDKNDAKVILRIGTETPLVCRKFSPLVKMNKLRSKIQKALIEDRYKYDGAKSIKTSSQYLPLYKEVPVHFREFLYESISIKSKNPKPIPKIQVGRFLIAALLVRKEGCGRKEFIHQIGCYGLGYGCMLRSEFYQWFTRTIFNARIKKAGIKPTYINNSDRNDTKTGKLIKTRILTPEEEQIKKQVMKEGVKVLKWLWQTTINFKV